MLAESSVNGTDERMATADGAEALSIPAWPLPRHRIIHLVNHGQRRFREEDDLPHEPPSQVLGQALGPNGFCRWRNIINRERGQSGSARDFGRH